MAFHINIAAQRAQHQKVKAKFETCDYVMALGCVALALSIAAVLRAWGVF